MSDKFVFLPPVFETISEWKSALEEAVNGIDVTVCDSRGAALAALPQARAAYGTLDPDLLRCAPNLEWAGLSLGRAAPELLLSRVDRQ